MTAVGVKVLTSSKKLVSGLSIVDSSLQDLVVEWVSQTISSCSNATHQESFRNLHLILFDSHVKTLPLKFLARNPTSMVLLEGVQHSASTQREFVAKFLDQRRHQPNLAAKPGFPASSDSVTNVPTLLVAYHSSFKDLLVPSKSKPFNERFLKTTFNPDFEYFAQAGVERSEVANVVFGCLPSPALQRSLLNSLYAQWLVYVHNEVERTLRGNFDDVKSTGSSASETTKTVFEISNFSIVTLLHSTTFAQMVCGKYEPINSNASHNHSNTSRVKWRDVSKDFAVSSDSPGESTKLSELSVKTKRKQKAEDDGLLAFYAKSHRHYSFLFNVLFEIRLLNGWNGFAVPQSFAPIPPEFKETSHADKLEKMGLRRDHFYAVSLRPRKLDELCAVMYAHGIDLYADVEEIVRLAFWLTDFTPKLRGTKPFNDELRRLLNMPDLKAVFPPQRLVSDVSPPEFLAAYDAVRAYFVDEISEEMKQRYNSFRDQFLKTSARNYVD